MHFFQKLPHLFHKHNELPGVILYPRNELPISQKLIQNGSQFPTMDSFLEYDIILYAMPKANELLYKAFNEIEKSSSIYVEF